jgi:hypothetical protein
VQLHKLLKHSQLQELHDDHAYCTTTTVQAKAAVARLRAVNPSEKAVDTLQQRIAEAEESESSSCSCPSCIQAAFRKQLSGSDSPSSAAAAAAVAALPCSMREEVMADAAAVAAQSSPHYAALLKLQGRDAAQEQATAAKAAKKILKAAARTATAAGTAAAAAGADKPTATTAAAAAATERAAYKHQQGAQGTDWQQMAWLRNSLVQMAPGPEKNLKFAMHGLDPIQMVSHFVCSELSL